MRFSTSYKLKKAFWLMLYLLLGYKLTQVFALKYYPHFSSFHSSFDLLIPFWPSAVLIYISMYLYVPLVLVMVPDHKNFSKVIKAYVYLSLVQWGWFFFFPVSYQLRASDDSLFSIGGFVVWIIYNLDLPLNSFPSMHVSLVFLGLFVVQKYHPSAFWRFFVWAIAIAISTLLVKQHYVADVLFGAILGIFIGWVTLIKNNFQNTFIFKNKTFGYR